MMTFKLKILKKIYQMMLYIKLIPKKGHIHQRLNESVMNFFFQHTNYPTINLKFLTEFLF